MEPQLIANVWAKDIDTLAVELQGEVKDGLTRAEAAKRLKLYGPNTFNGHLNYSLLKLFLSQFTSPLIIILLLAAGVSFFFNEILDAVVILAAVGASIGLGFYQEYKAERATEALRSYIEVRSRVLRDGIEIEVDSKEIVPGDIILLRAGERVPADGRIFDAYNLEVDESVLTGESLPVEKSVGPVSEATALQERTNMLFSGTYVDEGQGRVLVTSTGTYTEFGKIATAVLKQKEDPTPLQKAVRNIGYLLALVTGFLLIFVYALGVSRGLPTFEIFLIAVAIAVGTIPEALPPGLTAILAIGVERIAKQNGIVRTLKAAETLGSTTTIITDKTGTLTTGAMELVDTFSLKTLLNNTKTSQTDRNEIMRLAVSNTNVIISNPDKPAAKWNVSGRHLDASIVIAAGKLGIPVTAIRKETAVVRLFNSSNKYSIYRYKNEDIVMGAPDILLQKSKLSSDDYQRALDYINTQSQEGKRLLGIAKQKKKTVEGKELDLEFVGVLVFYDPLRTKMKELMAEIEGSGVRVIMATGDLPGTAVAIAKKLGWQDVDEHVISGADIRSMTDEELDDALNRVRVFARMTPEDKYRIIELLQAKGEIVAMLGDGVNDAPSLKRANIGVAIGSGTDVAKGVSDLVLLDDNFKTIKAAIDEGRLILSNIRKMFVYLMTDAFDEAVILGGSLALGLTLPLSPLQIIWVNFVTSSIPAIAFAFDNEYPKKRDSKGSILDGEVMALTFGLGSFTSVALLLLYYYLVQIGYDNAIGRTFFFACFASYMLLVAYSLRNLHKPLGTYAIFSNKVLNIGVLLGIFLLSLTIYVPYLQHIFGTAALSSGWVALVLLWVASNILLVEIVKFIFIYNERKQAHKPVTSGQA